MSSEGARPTLLMLLTYVKYIKFRVKKLLDLLVEVWVRQPQS